MDITKENSRLNILMGDMFYQIRMDKGLSQEDVARNIISQRAVSKFEKSGDMPNCLVLCALMQRMGESMDYFTTMLSRHEYEYFSWRKDILRQIQENRIDEAVWQCEMAKDRTLNANLQEQFINFWTGYRNDDVKMMQDAIFLTIDNPLALTNGMRCASTTEISYMLICLEKRAEQQGNLDENSLLLLDKIIKHIRDSKEEPEKVKVFGKAVCIYGRYMTANSRQKMLLYKEALELQRKYAKLDDMTELLTGLLDQYAQMGMTEKENYSQMLKALVAVQEEFGVNENAFVVQELNTEYVLLHEVLKSYRQERKLSVRDIDEQACSEKTYRALEKGERAANHGTYELLAELMDIRIGKYHADIISDKYSDYKLAGEIVIARQSQQRNESLQLIDRLEASLGELAELDVNKQFILRWRNIQDFYDGKISPAQFIEKTKDAIRLTIPHWDMDYGTHFYLKTELTLVYYIAAGYRAMGRTNEALDIMERVWNVYDGREIDACFNMDMRILFWVFWKNLLTDKGEYGKALDMAKTGIEMCFTYGRGSKLNNFVTEFGWCIEHSDMGLLETDKRKKYTRYYKNALAICELFQLTRDEAELKKYCDDRKIRLDIVN